MFDIDIADMLLTDEQKHVMDMLCTLKNSKAFFMTYIAKYVLNHNKK